MYAVDKKNSTLIYRYLNYKLNQSKDLLLTLYSILTSLQEFITFSQCISDLKQLSYYVLRE
jgi:hypothetical protein